MKSGATGTTKGTKIIAYVVPSGHKTAGSIAEQLPFIFDGVKYLVEVENIYSSQIFFGYNFTWFED